MNPSASLSGLLPVSIKRQMLKVVLAATLAASFGCSTTTDTPRSGIVELATGPSDADSLAPDGTPPSVDRDAGIRTDGGSKPPKDASADHATCAPLGSVCDRKCCGDIPCNRDSGTCEVTVCETFGCKLGGLPCCDARFICGPQMGLVGYGNCCAPDGTNLPAAERASCCGTGAREMGDGTITCATPPQPP